VHGLCGGLRVSDRLLANATGRGRLFVFRLEHADNVRLRNLRPLLAGRIVRQHDAHTHTENALSQQHVPNGGVDVDLARIARLQHVAVAELHALGSLRTQFAGHLHFATTSTVLHDVPHHTVAGLSDSQAVDQLEFERLGLRKCTQPTVVHTFGVQLDGAVGEVESLLHHRRQLTNPTALLAQHILGFGGLNDDFGALRRDTDLHARVAVLGELANEKRVQLGKEQPIGNKLAFLRDLCCSHAI